MDASSAAADQSRLLEHINASWTTQAIAVACDFDLPDRLFERTWPAGELAADIGADADALARLLRALVTLDIVAQPAPDAFTLGALGHFLRRDHEQGLRNWAMLNGGHQWERWRTLAAKVREGSRSGPTGTPGERFRQLGADSREAALFHSAMVELSRRLGHSLAEHLTLPTGALVVDVGGGSGELLASVLKRHRCASGILFDQDHALAHAAPVLRRHGVADRCLLQPGSFFDEVPPGGSAYLMKSVLHDWDDDHAVRLLARCRAALVPGVPLVIIERIMPGRLSATAEHRGLARSDLNMLVGPAGRERSLEEYETLLASAGLMLHATQRLAAGFTALHAFRSPDARA